MTDDVYATAHVDSAVELAVVERSGFVESRHIGSAVVIAPDGSVHRTLGDPGALVFPRSTMKPFQALASMSAGAALSGPAAVIMMASHTGTPAHVELVSQILATAGVGEADLGCPAELPADREARADVIRAGGSHRRIYMECSGKHAAMLLACRASGWPIESYLEPRHPVQVAVREITERLIGEKVAGIGVDGCGAPVFAMPLTALARGIHRFVVARTSSPFALFRNAAGLTAAALAAPWALAGPGRSATAVMMQLGVFAKTGVEGMLVLSAPNGTTVAVKMLDGSSRASLAVGLRLLEQADAVSGESIRAVWPALHLDVAGGTRAVGRISLTF